MDIIDKRIELLHKVQEEQRRRERIQEEADRLHMAGDFQKEGELYAGLRDDSILQNLFRQLDELTKEAEENQKIINGKKAAKYIKRLSDGNFPRIKFKVKAAAGHFVTTCYSATEKSSERKKGR